MAVKLGYKIPTAITTSSTTAAAADRLPNVKSLTFPSSRAVIDTSNAKDAAADASRRSVLGLYEGAPAVSLQWDESDSICGRLRTAHDADSAVWVQYTADNTWGAGTGMKMECKVSGIELSASPDGTLDASVTFAPNGKPTVI